MSERLDELAASLQSLLDGLAAAVSQSQPMPPGEPSQTITFDANVLQVGVDDNGQPTYKARGGQFAKFGVRIWPEVLPVLGIDPATLKPGPNPVTMRLVALMGEKGPRKVISLAK